MEVSNSGGSIYHRFFASYCRSPDETLIYTAGPFEHIIRDAWPVICARLPHGESSSSPHHPDHRYTVRKVSPFLLSQITGTVCDHDQRLVLRELQRADGGQVVGIIIRGDDGSGLSEENFEDYLCSLLLRQIQYLGEPGALWSPPLGMDVGATTDAIVNLFDDSLRYCGTEDQWEVSGRDYFWKRVHQFTSRNARIHLCLPAFPCKSSNPDKVAGQEPDRGEELALTTLHLFVRSVQEIYPPGAKLWIISDGHVFSDCIGVDDGEVDSYGEKLMAMNAEIARQFGNEDGVGFKSLVDLFDLDEAQSRYRDIAAELRIPEIEHHIGTTHTTAAELSRRILMESCQPNRAAVRAKIDGQDPSILALYRGFSRFMLEDLDLNRYTRSLSRSQRKKLATKVSFEMIMRNQAYSNLVELIFPMYIRLSIHAHRNSGPKFGISLFGRDKVKATEQLSPDGATMSSRDLLHVPTPWHNCVVKIPGHPVLYVTKAKVARDALAAGHFTGGLAGGYPNQGGYFLLHAKQQPVETQLEKKAVPRVTVWETTSREEEKLYHGTEESFVADTLYGAAASKRTTSLFGPLTALLELTGLLVKLTAPSAWWTFNQLLSVVAPRRASTSV